MGQKATQDVEGAPEEKKLDLSAAQGREEPGVRPLPIAAADPDT